MKAGAVHYTDLLRAPYAVGGRDARVGIDCWGLAIEILQRADIASAQDLEASVLHNAPGDRWELVGTKAWQASRVGDVIYSVSESGEHHVTVVAQESPAVLLTTAKRHGVTVTRSVLIQDVLGVYRWRVNA